jgi:hypothetical protein
MREEAFAEIAMPDNRYRLLNDLPRQNGQIHSEH